MDSKFLDRIFTEIDNNTIKLEKLAKLVYSNSTTVSILTKLLIAIISFLIISSITIIYKTAKINTQLTNTDHEIYQIYVKKPKRRD